MRIATLTTVLAIMLFGTVAIAQNINYDFDGTTDFSRFKTYAWVPGTANLSDPLNHRRIVQAVNTQLASKGLAVVERGANPDVLVAYHASFDRDLQISGFSTGWGAYRFGGSRSGSVRAEEILIGTVAVDIVNAKTNAIVWRGMASKELDPKADPEKRERNINKAAEKLFKNYPPQK